MDPKSGSFLFIYLFIFCFLDNLAVQVIGYRCSTFDVSGYMIVSMGQSAVTVAFFADKKHKACGSPPATWNLEGEKKKNGGW